MATNENSTSNNQNYVIDIPLYTESQITRQQAIHEIVDIILRSNMKPQIVKDALQLLQKCLPSDNTLPTTIDELFDAIMPSENDRRLTQYLIEYKQCPSSSSSDDENDLTPYDRLQQCLQPITDLSRNVNLNPATPFHNSNNLRSFSLDQRSPSTSDSFDPSIFLESFKHLICETSSRASTREQNSINIERMLKQFQDDSDDDETSLNENKKLCCFELNGYDLLNGGKRRGYY